MFLGKYARPNQEARLDKTLPQIEFCLGAKRDIRNILGMDDKADIHSPTDWDEREVKISTVYYETYIGVMETNLWGHGPLESDFEVTDEAEFNFVVNEKTESMSSSFLDAMTIGDSRKLEYYVQWYIRSRYSSSRSEEFVSLKLLPTTASSRQDSIEKT